MVNPITSVSESNFPGSSKAEHDLGTEHYLDETERAELIASLHGALEQVAKGQCVDIETLMAQFDEDCE